MLARPVTTMPRAAPATRPKTSPGTIRECDRAPKAHILAPSTAHTPQTHSAHGHNRPRGCTAPHPRPHIHPKPTAHMATIPVEGAHPRTLDRTYTPNPQHTRPQFLSRVHTPAPSTAHTPQIHGAHNDNRPRGCISLYPRGQLRTTRIGRSQAPRLRPSPVNPAQSTQVSRTVDPGFAPSRAGSRAQSSRVLCLGRRP